VTGLATILYGEVFDVRSGPSRGHGLVASGDGAQFCVVRMEIVTVGRHIFHWALAQHSRYGETVLESDSLRSDSCLEGCFARRADAAGDKVAPKVAYIGFVAVRISVGNLSVSYEEKRSRPIGDGLCRIKTGLAINLIITYNTWLLK